MQYFSFLNGVQTILEVMSKAACIHLYKIVRVKKEFFTFHAYDTLLTKAITVSQGNHGVKMNFFLNRL